MSGRRESAAIRRNADLRNAACVAQTGPQHGATMTDPRHDPASIAGKPLHVDERVQVLVVGAGPVGLAAALEARRLGAAGLLAGGEPSAAETRGDDVPLHFGGRPTGAVRSRNAMLAAFTGSDPTIAEAFDAGIALRLGTACWGIYANGPSVGWRRGRVAGRRDGGRAGMVAADRITVAAGRRD